MNARHSFHHGCKTEVLPNDKSAPAFTSGRLVGKPDKSRTTPLVRERRYSGLEPKFCKNIWIEV